MNNEELLKVFKNSGAMPDLTEFFAELGLTNLSPEKKQEFTDKITDILQKRLLIRLADVITDDDAAAMEKMGDQDVMKYFDSKGINIALIVMEEAGSMKAELMENMAYVKGLIDAKRAESEGDGAK